jgi:hypothetical protein
LQDANKIWTVGSFGLFYSGNGGDNWQPIQTELRPLASVSVDQRNPDLILLGAAGLREDVCRIQFCALRTANGGITWQGVLPGVEPFIVMFGAPLHVEFNQFNPQEVSAGPYHSNDAGVSWQPGRTMPWGVSYAPDLAGWAYGYSQQVEGDLVRTTDGGSLWLPVDAPEEATQPQMTMGWHPEGSQTPRVYAYECKLGDCRFWWKLDEPAQLLQMMLPIISNP